MDGNASPRIVLQTDMAVMCAFDPQGMKGYVRRPRQWVYSIKDGDYSRLEQVQQGVIAVWPLGGKGGRYTARVVADALPAEWQPYVKGSVAGYGVVVESGQLFVGPGERIPGDGFGDRLVDLEDEGKLIAWPNGRLAITVHVLEWKGDDRFFDEEGEPNEQAPPDLALVLTPAPEGPFPIPGPCPPLIDFLPKPKMKPQPAVLPRPRIASRPEVARPAAGRARAPRREAPEWKPAADPLPPPRPGEIRVGMLVRHAQFGDGTVLFIREGFPKVKVDFRGREEKVDRSELTVVAY